MNREKKQLQRYFITLSFDGSPFFGWQRQQGDVPTVQKMLEESLSMLLRNHIEVVGAGRTDTGVHALEYYAHFDSDFNTEKFPLNLLAYKLNRILPAQIAINQIFKVDSGAHARYSALSRTYQYRILTRKDPFETGRAWHFEPMPDLAVMQQAADILLETQDFACFSKSNTQVKTTICSVMSARWWQHNHIIIFEITANRFLRNMVRAIVGTLIDVGLGKTSIEQFRMILESRNRQKAGYSVPGHGLFLTQIEYPRDIFKA